MRIILDDNDFKIADCPTGKQGFSLCVSMKPNLVILDINLPDMSGLDVIKSLREWSEVPIIVMSARAEDTDIIEALNLGANDYVTKPFSADVFFARIKAALRSSVTHDTGHTELTNGLLRIDLVRYQVFLGEKLLSFTPKEYSLFHYFMTHQGKMLTHREILKAVWGDAHCEDIQYLRVFIGQIREKIETNPADPTIIVTEAGVGYRMEITEATSLYKQGDFNLS